MTSPPPEPVVDAERLHRVLRLVTSNLTVLHGYAAADPRELVADPVRLGHIKYTFVVALEACIDAAQHVCASEGFAAPDTNADAMRELGRHRVLSVPLADAMAAAVGFRNVLVHLYVDVDDDKVIEHLGQLGDLEGFVDALSRLLDDGGEE
jgi:uncharacterized protein YutE (UPF0331/DUF86 family)